MLEKVQSLLKRHSSKLLDLKNLSTGLFAIIVVLVSWSGAKVIQTNYELQREISGMQQANDVQKLGNTNLKLQNRFLNTNEFLELSAREHFNKGLPGETLVLVPRSTALAHAAPAVKQTKTVKPADSRPWYERNFNAWLDFLFHREDNG